jgi:hypothetical protein
MTLPFSRFREISSVALGALAGALIGLPWSGDVSGGNKQLLVIAFAALGALMGYRQRRNTFFFYFCLFAVVTLASLISANILGA